MFEDVHEISDWREIISRYEIKAGFREGEVIFAKSHSTSNNQVAWLGFETGSGVAQSQTLFTANPLPHLRRQGEGNIFAHKAFYKPEQWGMERKGL